MLKIERLTKTFGDKRAVDDLTLHIQRGNICAFIGHNGAGKTTTIKACCGIMGIAAGFQEGLLAVPMKRPLLDRNL